MKIMQLDSTIAETHLMPVHPDTGQQWYERWKDLFYLYWQTQDQDATESDFAAYRELGKATKYEVFPKIVQYHFSFGAAFAGQAIPTTHGCHPNTWAKFSDAEKATYDKVVDNDAWRVDNAHLLSPA